MIMNKWDYQILSNAICSETVFNHDVKYNHDKCKIVEIHVVYCKGTFHAYYEFKDSLCEALKHCLKTALFFSSYYI